MDELVRCIDKTRRTWNNDIYIKPMMFDWYKSIMALLIGEFKKEK